MILIGLLFFIFASLGPELVASSRKTKLRPTPKTQAVRNSPRASKKVLFNFRYPEHKGSKEIEKKIRQERRMAPTQTKRKFEESELEMPTLDEVPEDSSISSFYQTIPTKSLSPNHYEPEKIETIPMDEDSFTIELNGLLFLDYSRNIPFQSKEGRNCAPQTYLRRLFSKNNFAAERFKRATGKIFASDF